MNVRTAMTHAVNRRTPVAKPASAAKIPVLARSVRKMEEVVVVAVVAAVLRVLVGQVRAALNWKSF